jgi:hypothetical protein
MKAFAAAAGKLELAASKTDLPVDGPKALVRFAANCESHAFRN